MAIKLIDELYVVFIDGTAEYFEYDKEQLTDILIKIDEKKEEFIFSKGNCIKISEIRLIKQVKVPRFE